MKQLLAELLLPFGVTCLWAAMHIILGRGIFVPLTYTEIREGNFEDVEDSTINDSSSVSSVDADDLQRRDGVGGAS